MNPRSELDRLAYLLNPDRTQVRNLLQAAQLNPDMRGTTTTFLQQMLISEGGDPYDRAALPVVNRLPPGQLRVGRVWNGRADGPALALPEGTRDNLEHIGIFGETRKGKTRLALSLTAQHIQAGGRSWVIDPEDEFPVLAAAVGAPRRPLVLRRSHLRVNFFQPPADSIPLWTWLTDLSLLLRQELFLRDGSINLFGEQWLDLLKQKTAQEGPGQWPSLMEVYDHFANLKLGGSQVRGKTWLESLLNRLGMVRSAFPETAHVTSSNMLSRLAGRSVVFRCRDVRGIPLTFLANFLLTWLARYQETRENADL